MSAEDGRVILDRFAEKRSKESQEESLPPEFSDDALALEFTRRHSDDLRYVPPWGKWFRWDGKRWAEDRIIRVYDLAREVCRDAAAKAEDKLARQITSAKTVAAVEKLARSDQRHAILPEQLDADPHLFNTPGGTVDLRTGQLRPHRREDQITKLAGATPDHDAADSTWIKFLDDITLGDKEIQDYLQRLFGYSLSADVRDHVLAFFYGTGGNGKNTLIDFVLHIVGDYGKPISTATLMEARGERHPTDIANLLGVRLAVSNEVEEGGRWAESKLKALTGDAVLSARFMRQDFFEFKRTHKLVVSGNHRPSIRVVDDAIRRRIHLVPFRARFIGDACDRDMPEKLKAEASAVLAWMVRGFLEWQQASLQPPPAVLTATEDYLATQDTFGLWLAECCDSSDPTAETKSGVLYGSFKAWKEHRGEHAPSTVRFSEQLEQRFPKEPRAGCVWYRGVSLKAAGATA
jgi:putative DNA primase/helicase